MYFYLKDPKKNISHCQGNASWRGSIIEKADESIENIFSFTDKYEMERCTKKVHFDKDIDWDYIPFGDNEWCFAFNRHTFLLKNAIAAAITGDTRYRDNWIRLFEDFFHRSELSEKTSSLSWRSLESGIRIENYVRCIEIFEGIGTPLDESTMDDIRKFFRIHIRHLLASHTAFHQISNWGVLQDHGLFLASLYLDDKKSMETALSRLDEEMRLQTFPDGMHWEQSTMYQAEVLHAAMDTIIVADRNGIAVPDALRKNTHLLATGLAKTLRPDGRSYLFGDSDEIDMRDMIASAAILFSDGILSHYAKGGLDEEFYMSNELDAELPPEENPGNASYYFKDSGNAILTLSEKRALRFHSGLIGSGHGHFDQLHFDLYADGSTIITDTGRFTYVDTEERRALKGASGHNTVIINGHDQSVMEDSWGVSSFAEPVFSDAVVDGDYKYLRASHLGYMKEGVYVTRSILTIEDRFVIIADDIASEGKAEASILYHFDEGTALKEENDGFRATKDKSSVKLIPFSGNASVSEYPMSKRYNEMLSSPLLTVKDTAEGRKLIVTLIAIGNEDFTYRKIPLVKPLSGKEIPEDISFGLEIESGSDRYSVAMISNEYPAGGFLIKAGEAEAYGRVFIRKNDEEAKVIRY